MLARCSGAAVTPSGRRAPQQTGLARTPLHSTAGLCRCTSTAPLYQGQQASQHRRERYQAPAALPAGGEDSSGSGLDLDAAFARELAARQAAEATAAEASASQAFDGQALLNLVRRMPRGEGRSYDLSLVKRPYLGKVFVALNVMWRYKEQKSFGYSEEEFMQRMEYIAGALRAWVVVTTVTNALTSTKERPRVGKAVSIMLDVPLDRVDEWLS